jgi:hypothetical protein
MAVAATAILGCATSPVTAQALDTRPPISGTCRLLGTIEDEVDIARLAISLDSTRGSKSAVECLHAALEA